MAIGRNGAHGNNIVATTAPQEGGRASTPLTRKKTAHMTNGRFAATAQKSTRRSPKSASVTKLSRNAAELEQELNALSKSQAVIEFDLDGTIRTANDNFLGAVGHSLDASAATADATE